MSRAEATAVLHLLKTTRGNTIMVVDNWSVVSGYRKGHRYNPGRNGLQGPAISIARKERINQGRGVLELVWIKPHFSNAVAISQIFSHFLVDRYLLC